MSNSHEDAILQFSTITGSSISTARVQLAAHGWKLVEAVSAHFSTQDVEMTAGSAAPSKWKTLKKDRKLVAVTFERTDFRREELEINDRDLLAENAAQLNRYLAISHHHDTDAMAAQYRAGMDHFSREMLDQDYLGLTSHQARPGLPADPNSMRNHRAALDFILQQNGPMTLDLIQQTHFIIQSGPQVPAGRSPFRLRVALAGATEFAPPAKVPALMRNYLVYLAKTMRRTDISPYAIAGAISHHFIAIHPFSDGNGRMGRLLINWALCQFKLPFSIVLCRTQDQRKAYIDSLKIGHIAGNSSGLALVIGQTVARAWIAFHRVRMAKEASRLDSTKGEILRQGRLSAQGDVCLVCMEDGPSIAALCCGVPFHVHCLVRWLQKEGEQTCPQCRHAIKMERVAPPVVPAPEMGETTTMFSSDEEDTTTTAASSVAASSLPEDTTTTESDSEMDEDTTTTTVVGAAVVGVVNECVGQLCKNKFATGCLTSRCGRCCRDTPFHGICPRHCGL